LASVGGGALAGGLIGSGIGLIAGATTAAATTAAAATSTSLISAGTSAGVSGISYMVQTQGQFETTPYLVNTAVAGTVGYFTPGAGLGTKMGLEIAGAELTYMASTNSPTVPGALSAAAGGVAGAAFDYGFDILSPSIMEFGFYTPGSFTSTGAGTGFVGDSLVQLGRNQRIRNTLTETILGVGSAIGTSGSSYYAQKQALDDIK
jgi:hypothetical protein